MKHVHISISNFIGEQTDAFGFPYPGFMAFMIDMYVGYNPKDLSSGSEELEKITLHIDSPGGDVVEGFAIHNKLQALKEKGVEIEVIIEGMCYSIATIIALAASPGKLKARSASMWMIHKPWNVTIGDEDDHLANYEDLREFKKPMIQLYASKSGKTKEEIEAMMKDGKYVSAATAKEYGFIDEILTAPSVASKPAAQKALAFVSRKSKQLDSDMATTTAANNKQAKDKDGFFAVVKAFFTADEPETPKATVTPKATKKPTPRPKAQEPETPQAASSETADGATFYHEGELAAGTAVFADAEMTEPLEDGTYDLQDGREMEVVDGAVSNLSEAAAEEEEDASASAETEQPAAQAKAKPQPKAKADPEVVALKKQLAAAEAKLKTVPGSGGKTEKPEQTYAVSRDKTAPSAFDAVAERVKQKYNLK